MTTRSGSRALRKIQFAKEVTPGTPVTTATAFVVGTLGMRMDQELYMPDELETGRLVSFERSEPIMRAAMLPFEADANYEQLGYPLGCAVRQEVISGISPSLWTYEPGYSTRSPLRTYTVQYGDDVEQQQVAYVMARQLELSGQVGEVVRVNADLFGRQVTPLSAFAPTNLTPPALETVKMATCRLYVRSAWTTASTAAAATDLEEGTLADFNWRYMTGLAPQLFADNRLDFSEVSHGKRHVELEMTVGFNPTTAATWFGLFQNQTARMVELNFNGTDNRQLRLQTYGVITEYNELTEREGQDIIKVKWVSLLGGGSGAVADRDSRVLLYNNLAALP